jgi:hypothetical protein
VDIVFDAQMAGQLSLAVTLRLRDISEYLILTDSWILYIRRFAYVHRRTFAVLVGAFPPASINSTSARINCENILKSLDLKER